MIFGHLLLSPKNKEHEFYCLQPIVVKAKQWSEKGETLTAWEVVDGQQRLTTIFIIISYWEKEFLKVDSLVEDYGKKMYSLRYESRPKGWMKRAKGQIKELPNDRIQAAKINQILPLFVNGHNR